jgi:hypothetical protein
MNKYTITAEGKPLDTFDDFGISLNYQIEDILDVTKRKTNFSKTIELPGTPNNNLFFEQIFDVNVDSTNFNPNISIPANIRIGDNEILNGRLQLLNIIIDNKDIRYEVIVAGSLRDIMSTFQDYYLSDLEFSKYNHTRDRDTIIKSWDYIQQVYGVPTQLESGEGYVYPYIVNGQSDDFLTKWYIYDAQPAVYVKTLMDELFRFSDYTYTSNFFESDYFKKLIIPYNEGTLQIPEETQNQRFVNVGVDGSQPEYNLGPTTGYKSIFGGQQIRYEDPWKYNSDSFYFFPLDRESGQVGDVVFQDNDNLWNEFFYVTQDQGYYNITFNGQLFAKWEADFSLFNIKWRGTGRLEYIYYLEKVSPDGSSVIIDQPIGDGQYPTQYYVPSDEVYHASPWYDTGAPMTFGLNAENVWLEAGDRIRIRFGTRWPSALQFQLDNGGSPNDSDDIGLRMVLKESFDVTPTALEISTTTSQSYGNEEIFMNSIVPKIKLKDFFLNIIKQFNLVVSDNPNKINDLIIEPRDNYFASSQRVLDWTPKLDNDGDVTITPMSDLDANTFVYKYKKDEDYFNETYFQETSREYGEYTVQIINDFSKEIQKNELIFSPTPDASIGIQDRVAPYFVDWPNNVIEPRKVNFRILFYDGLLDCETFELRDDEFNDENVTTLTQYPYCGMWDNPYSPTEDLGFGRTDKIYWETSIYPVNNLFERFHKKTLESIIDPNSRLLEGLFFLTPKDIANFDFRDMIFLNGAYWRVNKISDYNPVGSDSLTKVELYKINTIDNKPTDQLPIPIANQLCPTDLQVIQQLNASFVISASGQEITQDCCESLGGKYSNGLCKVLPIGPIIDPVDPSLPAGSSKWPTTSIGVIPVSNATGPLAKQKNNNSYNIAGTQIIGKRNYLTRLGDGRAMVVGDDNSVISRNTMVIGNNITANQDNTLYIGNILIDENGEIHNNKVSIIDAGEDTVLPVSKTNLIDIVDGTVDSVRNFGGDQTTRPIIYNDDSGQTIS